MAWKYSTFFKINGEGIKFIKEQLESAGFTILSIWNGGWIVTTQMTSQQKTALRNAMSDYFREEQIQDG